MSTHELAPESVSVLIPVLDASCHLDSALAMTRTQDIGDDAHYYFIDGGSTDGTRERLLSAAASDPRITVLDNPLRTTQHALNIGLSAAHGEFIARMDAHTRFGADYLRIARDRIRGGNVAHVSGPAIARGMCQTSRAVTAALHTPLGMGGSRVREVTDHEIELDSGFCGMWRADLLHDLGGWDPLTYPNEDAELAARVRGAGGRVVSLPALAAWYTPRGSLRDLARQYYRYGRYRMRTSVLHPDSMRAHHLAAPMVVAATALAAVPARSAALRHTRTAARIGVGAYAAAVGATAWKTSTAHDANPLRVAAALVTMHSAWGLGAYRGMASFGLPVNGLRHVVGAGIARTRA